jgi:hypothetical protein
MEQLDSLDRPDVITIKKLLILFVFITFFVVIVVFRKQLITESKYEPEYFTSNISSNFTLFRKKVSNESLYFSLDASYFSTSTLKSFINSNELEVLYKSDFFDPKRCAGMLIFSEKDNIFFVEATYSQTKERKISTYFYVFNTTTKTLRRYSLDVGIQKEYRKNGEIYLISKSENKNNLLQYVLHTFSFDDKNLVLKKDRVFTPEKDYSLITATTTLTWCDFITGGCIAEDSYKDPKLFFKDDELAFLKNYKYFLIRKTKD